MEIKCLRLLELEGVRDKCNWEVSLLGIWMKVVEEA